MTDTGKLDSLAKKIALPARVIVIDDDDVCASMVRELCIKFGLVADVAYTGKEGLAAVELKPYDLILLDLRMPEMDGVDFIQQCRKLHINVPIVVVTGLHEGTLLDQVRELGIMHILFKPIDRDVIGRALRDFGLIQ